MFPQRAKTNIAMATAIAVIVVAIDQAIKVEVKTHFALHEAREVTSWMYIYFVENSGMAFGVNIAGTLLLTIARLLFVAFLVYYLAKVARRVVPRGFIVCVALIIAGAVGNIIDNAFYGLLFTESTEYGIATTVPLGEGYGSFMEGKVVDMFYFPIIDTFLPTSWPVVGGSHFVFFSPIFNFADSAITCGSLAILLFYRRCLASPQKFQLLPGAGANAKERDENRQ